MGYKIYYSQNIDGVSTNQSIDTFDNIFTLNPLNSPWGSSGCYAGATPANGSDIGTYSVASWSGFNDDIQLSDMRDVSVRPVSGNSTQNLRFMIRFNSDLAYSVGRQSFKWTGIVPERAEQMTEQIETNLNTARYSIESPYTRNNDYIGLNGSSNSPLLNAPLTSLKINELVFLPHFIFIEREYYNYNDTMGGYQNLSTGTAYTKLWSEIKSEDKTAAGSDFDSDLFENGWKEIQAVNPDGRRFVHCLGVALQPYYGKSSYRFTNDAYIQSTNPDDGKVYGTRNQFGFPLTPQNESPSIVNNYYRAPYLYVITENYDSNAEGVCYSTPAGLYFTHHINSSPNPQFNSYSITSRFQRINSVSWNPAFYTNNNDTNNVYKDFKSGDPIDSDLSIYSDILENDIVISPIYNITEPYTGTIFYVQNNGQAFSFGLSSRVVNPVTTHIYPIGNLWATIASLGCYVAADAETATKAQTGAYTGENNNLYLGFMDASGITNGTMLQGGDIINSTQAGIDDIIQNTPYTPVEPGPGPGPGGDDPSNPPSPSGKSEGKLTGAETIGHKTREFGSGSVTYYGLNVSQVEDFKAALWAQPADFYDAIQIAGRQNTSIFDYIASFRYYPSNMNVMGISIGAAQPVYLGTGAKFSKSDGTDFLLNPMAGFFGQIEWCRWNLSDFTGWRENFLDYAPYLKMSIYLPYAGTFDLDPQVVASINPIQQATIYARACVDLNTGSLTYFIDADGVLVLEKTIKFGVDLPLTGNDSVQQSTAIIRSTNSLVSTVLGGAAAVGTSIASGNVVNAAGAAVNTATSLVNSSVDAALANRQVPVQVGGFGGTMSNITQGQDPYITIYRQKIANPKNYGHTVGYLTQSTHKISELTGFTKCTNPDLSGINATDEEKAEIQQILTTGFYA